MAYEKIFPTKIVEMIGKERFAKACYTEWEQKWVGATGYIDGTRPDDFPDRPIFYGIDGFGRPFVFLKVISIKDDGRKEIMINIFQRYTDNTNLYVACCSYEQGDTLLKHGCRIDDELYSHISLFLVNGFVEREKTEYQSKCRLEISQ